MKFKLFTRLQAAALVMLFTHSAWADMVSYAADFETSRLNPVTNILILERDTSGTVHGTVYPSDVPGTGGAVIVHNPPFTPIHSLLIGLTDGEDEEGNPKQQLVMFVDDDFAAANDQIKFSTAFPGARHSVTTANLLAATAGDADQIAWFTDTFFTGPAAAAVFETYGSFSVAEFTQLSNIGNAVTSGTWVQNQPIVFYPGGDPGGQDDLPTAELDETATNAGPYDIQVEVDGDGEFAMVKSVVNGSSGPFTGFTLEVGTGLGANFVPTANTSNLRFTKEADTLETTGAFPNLVFGAEQISFTGSLAQGETANFVFFVFTNNPNRHNVTVRQRSVGATSRATFNVAKLFDDGNPAAVEATLSCTTGLPLVQSQMVSQGSPLEFIVQDFDDGDLDCEVTESVPQGYSVDYESNGGIDSDEGLDACRYLSVGFGGDFTCVITNTLQPVRVDVSKIWIDDMADVNGAFLFARADWHCSPVANGGMRLIEGRPDGGSLSFKDTAATLGLSATDAFWFYPHYNGSDCDVTERENDSDVVSDDSDCQQMSFFPGYEAELDEDDNPIPACTIINTRIYAGIPTLSEYGLTLLALLMLGVGFFAYRRIA